MKSPWLQGLNHSEALQIPRCIFPYHYWFTCINSLFEQLQPLRVKSEVETLPWMLLLTSNKAARGVGVAHTVGFWLGCSSEGWL